MNHTPTARGPNPLGFVYVRKGEREGEGEQRETGKKKDREREHTEKREGDRDVLLETTEEEFERFYQPLMMLARKVVQDLLVAPPIEIERESERDLLTRQIERESERDRARE